jgi:hypothetical protein
MCQFPMWGISQNFSREKVSWPDCQPIWIMACCHHVSAESTVHTTVNSLSIIHTCIVFLQVLFTFSGPCTSSSSAWQPFIGHSIPWISWQQDFYRVGLSTPRWTPNLEDQASVFMTLRDRVTQLYSQALGTHFSHLLRHAWGTLGLFLSSGHHTDRSICIAHISNVLTYVVFPHSLFIFRGPFRNDG